MDRPVLLEFDSDRQPKDLEAPLNMEYVESTSVTAKKYFGRLGSALVEFVASNFLRLNIANKLLLGFSSLLVLLVVISAFALTNLNRLNSINQSILQTDLPIIMAADRMIDLILAEELYARRYMVFRTADVLDIFLEKKNVFDEQLRKVNSVPEKRDFPLAELASFHDEYIELLLEGVKTSVAPSNSMTAELEEKLKIHQEKFVYIVKAMSKSAQLDQNEKTGLTTTIGATAFQGAKVLCALGLILSLAAATIITRNISGAIRKLKLATEMIASGEFDHRPDISNKDELGDLADAFVAMAERLKNLEEMNLDTSPLTRLPGGTTIGQVMEKRIEAEMDIAFCLMDIDNFKAYNDNYGYAKGNEVIQSAADVITQAVADYGCEEDFIGHIGGDDYVVITTPDKCEKICQAVTEYFDKAIPGFYNSKDRKRGYIEGENRQGDEMLFPLASISIAVVTNYEKKLTNHIEFGEAAAELKEEAKSMTGSVYVVDQRKKEDGSKKDRSVIKLKKTKPKRKKKGAAK